MDTSIPKADSLDILWGFNFFLKSATVKRLTPTTYKSAIVELSHLEVISDDGWLFETQRTQKYIQMNSPTEYLDLTPSSKGFLWNGVIQISQVVTRYERKYTKLQTVLGQIQGSAATVILILVIVLRPYSQVKFSESLINDLFDVKMKKRGNKKGENSKKGNDKKPPQKQEISQHTTTVLSVKETTAELKARSSLNKIESGKTPKLEIQLKDIVSGGFEGGDLESARATDFPTTDRGLLTVRGTEEVIQFPDAELRVERFNSTHSFKRLMFAIDQESGEIPRSHFYQKPPLPQNLQKYQISENKEKLEAIKIPKIELNMILEKPEKVKLPPMADFVSDCPETPKKFTEYSFQEEKNDEEKEKDDVQEQEKRCENIAIPLIRLESGMEQGGKASPRMIDLKDKIGSESARRLRSGATFQDEDDIHYESSKIDISIWEFIFSFFKKTEKTKEKFEVLDKGMKNVRERMDILNIMKKFRELDKLKTLLLEDDQLVLFNAIPKAEMRARGKPASIMMSSNDLLRANSFSRRIIKRSTFIDLNVKQEQIRKSYDSIQLKTKKSKLDYRLLEIYDDIMS